MKKINITFLPSGKKVKAKSGDNLLDILRNADIPVLSYCGGQGTCGKCKVIIRENIGLSEITEEEKKLIGNGELRSGYRLSCRVNVFEDLTVYVPYESLSEDLIRGKNIFEVKTALLPVVKCYPLNLPPPSLEDPRADIERIKDGLRHIYGVSVSSIDPLCMSHAPQFLRENNWRVNVCVRMDTEILDFKSINTDEIYGLAIDIGTTTIGMYMVNLKDGGIISSGSILNPQVRFGEDVISRLNYIMKKGQKGLRELNILLIEGLNKLIDKLSREAKISKDDIMEVVAVGNTVMHHILLNIYPVSLSASPFVPHLTDSFDVKAREIGLNVAQTAYVHTLPIEAGFVGADNVACILSLLPELKDGPFLMMDVGTNGEIVFGVKKKLLSASCATGPAFEGASIKDGMRAHLGAIEKVKIDKETFDVSYKVIGNSKPKGICGSGIIDAVSELFKVGLIDNSGRFFEEKSCERLRKKGGITEFVIAWERETLTGKKITVTQKDIRALQLAKAALYAGSKILISKYGQERPKKIYLAGAFGTYIDIKSAYILGMFPFCKVEDIIPKGNLAGLGACIALMNRKKRKEAERFARKVEYVELSAVQEFEKEFLDALYIPHARDFFPELERLLGE